ncbi:MAG: metallophosphoesterase [Lachnospiraceae bacterium]|nr:metallophosphoesterase [Lachnospiraceae bacterium]
MIYILTAAILLALILFVYRESRTVTISEYDLTGKDIKAPVRFVMVSDLHDTDVTGDDNRKLLDMISGCDPDFVILSGDMVTSRCRKGHRFENAYSFLEGLSRRHRVYYGLGNHEQRWRHSPEKHPGRYAELCECIDLDGITLLSDSYIDIEDKNIRIYGFDVPMEYYARGMRRQFPDGLIEGVFGKVADDRYNILLAHTPEHFREYVDFHPDLVLSGHLHGGVIGIPGIGGLISPQLKLFPKYASGKFEKEGTTMIVSRGIGWHSIPVRIFNPAEIVIINIRPDIC